MNILGDFDINVDKDKVFKVIDCHKDSSIYENVESAYWQMYSRALNLIKPKAVYKIGKPAKSFNIEELRKFELLIYCLITLGEDISNESNKLISGGEYLNGLVLNVIADEILFQISNQLYKNITASLRKVKPDFGLSKRFSPGGGGIPIEYQKEIVEVLGNESLDIEITEGYMIKPVKSLTYVYGTGRDLPFPDVDHDCSSCIIKDCKYSNGEYIDVLLISQEGEREIQAAKGESLLKNFIQNNIYIESPCLGQGNCGKCKIQIIKGAGSPTENELVKLTKDEIRRNIRLACCTYPSKGMNIRILDENREFYILSDYKFNSSDIEPIIEIKTTNYKDADLNRQKSITETINQQCEADYKYSLDALKKLATLINDYYSLDDGYTLHGERSFNIIAQNNKVIDVCSIYHSDYYGVAVDIGTTTIAFALIDLKKGISVGTHTAINSQRQFGADVISRIQYSRHEDSKILTKSIRNDIVNGISELSSKYKVALERIYSVVIAGNTTMLHFLLDIPAYSISVSPFRTVTTSLLESHFSDIFENSMLDCYVTLLPGISAYVGADTVSGMINIGFDKLDGINMLIDIGTNGEIAIGDKNRFFCASAAAGPALEGANISCGMGSVKGAICSVNMNNGIIAYKTIGQTSPLGICGSGVIDIISSGLKSGIIDNTGKLDDIFMGKGIPIAQCKNCQIYFSQKDIREVQLAKSAIRSAVELLINKYNCKYDDIRTVYLAGGFGNNLNLENALNIGLLPKALAEKIKTVGNSSLGGAVDYMLNKEVKDRIYSIIKKTCYFELSGEEEFNKLFIENINF